MCLLSLSITTLSSLFCDSSILDQLSQKSVLSGLNCTFTTSLGKDHHLFYCPKVQGFENCQIYSRYVVRSVSFFFSLYLWGGENLVSSILMTFWIFFSISEHHFIHLLFIFFFPIGLWSITHNILGPWSWRRSYVKCAHNVEWCLDSFGSFDSGTVALFETTSFGFWLRRL